ncbi:hypothetical protein WK43_23455 [Burkholderia ubonensis]|nr:hypothetical protein WK37_00130 [Burkholderia ubonensis]KVS50483.1 hypothetical protein WK38_14430 [Burkholderia ubonensis]KVS84440.1 hypothetical protein WK42_06005 [Burkholderia ubonensis]KVS84603.1 hypothetical protein WK43_23455 [Burkholderia ubonensis]KVS91771.1 hypothetical protein WK44_13490 [Burkholderia ubonensis]
MREEGISVLLVEQNARMVLKISDYAYVLDDGDIVHSGSSRELAADENRVRALTGVSTRESMCRDAERAVADVRPDLASQAVPELKQSRASAIRCWRQDAGPCCGAQTRPRSNATVVR